MLRCFFLLTLLLTVQVGRAQTATATLDSARITVGSATTLTLEVRAPQGVAVQWPALPDSLEGLEILSRGKVDTVRDAAGILYRQRAQLTGFDSGVFEVPPISFGMQSGSIETTPIPLIVHTLAVDTAKPFRPIKDILEVPGSWMDNWPYLLTGLALAGLFLFFLLRKKSPPKPEKPKPVKGASATALQALQELEKSGLAERGEMKEFFSRASDILRRYLEGRFSIRALEEPTDDLLRDIRKNGTLKPQAGALQEFFLTADLAKFAKSIPTTAEAHEAIGQARAFIQTVDRGGMKTD